MATEAKARAGYLYVLRPHVLIDGQRIIKIGSTTRSVAEKVRHLESRSSVMYDEIYSVYVEDARALERQLHARYAHRKMAGGSEGFFHMEPEEVIPEVDKIAAELTRSWLAKAHNTELSASRRKNGAYRFRTPITAASNIIWLLTSLLLGFGAVLYSPFRIQASSRVWAFAVSLIVAAILVRLVLSAMSRLIKSRYISRRFDAAIRQKDQELREKYPLS
jgi:hypothetical protein